ncbi:MAG: gliding motility-associated C-terminal domain-containing protein [Bacteroidales bacterium]|nr:gliding motility-associated C-terminal domain-containing protein [Bacteroidales bacterium]
MRKITNLCFIFLVCFNISVFSQFIENKGQVLDWDENFHPEVQYLYASNNNSMFFESNRVVCTFASLDEFDFSRYEGDQNAIDSIYKILGREVQRIDIEFIGATNDCKIIPGEKNKNYLNYFLNKRSNITNVGSYKSICYKNIYPNIDVVFNQYEGGLKYDVILHKGANIEDVKIKYNGANSLEIIDGQVIVKTKFFDFEENIPEAYYNDNKKENAEVYYELNNDIISFKCDYKNSNKLIIDPTITWMTYYETVSSNGQISYDHNASDDDGNLFISGYCNNSVNDYPIVNPGGSAYIQNYTLNDLYIAKFNPNRELVWGTYFGGSNSSMDWQLGTEPLVVHENILHVVGDELASNGPFLNGGGFYYNPGSTKPYYARFDKTTGELKHCTNIPGHTSSHPSIAVSSSGQVAIILHAYNWGVISSHIVNRAGAYNQSVNGGFTDLFLMLLNSSYNQIWGTFLGGPGTQEDCHVAFDNSNNIFFVSEVSWSSSTSNASNEHLINPGGGAYYQSANASEDIMIGKFSNTGALAWNTLYGGNAYDGIRSRMGNGTNIVVNKLNEIVVLGGTNSDNLPLHTMSGAYNKTAPSNVNNSGGSFNDFGSFILKFSNNGLMQWATYWGGDPSGGDLLYDGKFTSCDKFIVCARTNSYTTIPLPGHYNKSSGGQSYLMQFDENYAAEWSSYIGNETSVPNISFSAFEDRLYLTTCSYSQTETTVNPGGGAYYDGSFVGPHYGSHTIWEFNIIPTPIISGDTDVCQGESTVLSASGGVGSTYYWYNSQTGGTLLHTGATYTTPALTSDVTYWVSSSSGSCISVRVPISVTVIPFSPPTSATANPNQVCSGVTNDITLTASGGDLGTGGEVQWFTSSCGGTPIGTGNPLVISQTLTSSTTYYARYSGVCGTTDCVSTIVNIDLNITANFTQLGPYCEGDTPDALPTTSTNGISGTWSPASISTTTSGTDTYTFTPTLGQCAANTTMTITITPNVTPTFAAVGPYCSGAIIPALPTTSTEGITGTWSPTINNTATTEYTFISDAGQCAANTTMTITIVPNPIASVLGNNPLCNGSNSGSIDLTISNGTSDYSIDWVAGNTTISSNNYTITGLSDGTYNISVTDANGCTDNVSVTITEPTELNSSITALVNQNCLTPGSATVTASGGTPNYTYTWPAAGSVSGGTASSLNVGNYIVTITDNNGCSTTQTVSIIDDGGLNVTSSVISDISCNGDNNGEIEVTITGGTPDYTIYWGTGNTTTSNLTYTISGLSAATYDITVTDMHGCQGLTNAIISEPTELIASSSATTISCNGQTADVTVSATGGTTPYTGTGTFTVNAGTHNYTVTDANGCSSVTSITVSEPLLLEASAVSTNILCNGETSVVTVNAIGGTTPYTGTGTFTVNAGTHNYTVTDANGCTDNVSVTITEPTELNSSITALVNQNCLTPGSATVTASGGTPNYTYTWPAAGSVSGGTASSLNVGNYIVTITDNNGCSTTQTVSIIDDGGLNVTSSVISDISCNGDNNGEIEVTITGGTPDYTIYWGTGNTTTSNLTYTISGLSAATYDITVTDMHGCQGLTNAIISEPTELIASSSATTISCNGQTADVTVSATGGTTPYTGTGTFTVNAGTHNYTVTDANGCSSVTSITVSEPLLLEANAISTNILCNGETSQVTISAIGGTTPYTGTGTFTVNAGTHNYTVTDANGCTDNVSVTIPEPQQLSMTIDVDNVVCYGESNGSALANVSGGTMPIHYLWSDDNHSTTASINFMPAGFYTLTVSDQNGCQIIETIQIQQSPQLTVSCNATPIVCEVTLGSVIATADGGSGGFSYWWSNAENSSQISNLTEGIYEVTVTDTNGCTATNTASVGIQGHINLTITETHPISCFGDNDAVLIVNASAAANPIDYLWSNNYTTDIISNIGAGFYTVSATDNWGCTGYASYDLNEPGQIQVSMSSTSVLCYGSNEGSASAIASSGSVPYSYLWSNNEISNTITGLYSGLYLITVTDNNNCSVTAQIDVPQPENPLNLTLDINGIACYGENSGLLNTQAFGGTPPYTYFWQYDQFTSTDANLNNLYAGQYRLLVTDANDCIIDTIASIFEPSAIDATYTYTRPTCIGNNNGSIEINVIGGTSPYLFSWNGGASPVNYLDGLTQGTYLVTITDANQCIYELRSVMIEDIDEDCIKIPNAFTPNTDGINDTWIIENIEMFPDAYINVFNRWGQQLFAGRGNSEPWNGTYNGKFVPTGSYIYTVDLYRNGQHYNGIVTVVY